MSKSTPKTLSEALKDLEVESKETLGTQLENLKNVLLNLEPKISAVANSAVSESSEHVKKAKDAISQRVEKNPLMALGIVAFVLLVLAWFMGQKSYTDSGSEE